MVLSGDNCPKCKQISHWMLRYHPEQGFGISPHVEEFMIYTCGVCGYSESGPLPEGPNEFFLPKGA